MANLLQQGGLDKAALQKNEERQTLKDKRNREGVQQIAGDENREPKISLIEIFFITPFYIISDGVDYILFFMALDDFGIMDSIRTAISQFYFVMLKRMGPEIWMTNLVVNGLKLIPYIGSVIPSTLIWFITIFIDRGAMNKVKKIMESRVGGKLVAGIAEKAGKTAGKI